MTKEEKKAYHKQYYLDHKEHFAELNRLSRLRNPKAARKRSLKYAQSDKGKAKKREQRKNGWRKRKIEIYAKNMVRAHVRRGTMTKSACEVCGNKDTQAHHPDYSKPLEVIWLCHVCHNHAHGRMLDVSVTSP